MAMDRWGRRLWYLINRRRHDRELEREMASHRALMGTDARRFGNTLRLREQAADAWGWRWLDELSRDLRFGVRQMLRAPGIAATAVLTLALGIGANTAIFSVINSLLLRPLPVHEPERLAVLGDSARGPVSWSGPVWQQIRKRDDLFAGSFAVSGQRLNLARGGEAQYVEGLWVSGEFFDVLGVRPLLGRTFTLDDDRPGGGPGGPSAVISHDFWQRRFGGMPDVIGRPIVLESVSFTIVGVAPPTFFGTNVGRRFDVALPMGTEPLVGGADSSLWLATRNWLDIVVRLRPDQTLERATAALRAIQTEVREAVLPGVPAGLQRVVLSAPLALTSAAQGLSPLRERYGLPLVVLLAVVVLVLLVACVNVANLLLARAVARRHEMSVRIATGASSGRLVRMLLAEASLLGAGGTALGLAVSISLSRSLVRQLSTGDTDVVFFDLSADWRVLLFTASVTLATTAVFGAAPAWYGARAQPARALGDGARGAAESGRPRAAAALVTVQLALSLVLVVGAGLFIRTFVALASQDFGFSTDRVLVVDVTPPMTRYTLPQLVSVYERAREAVTAVPGVERAALSDITPIGGSQREGIVDLPGAETLPLADRLIKLNVVSPGWFGAYGTRLLAGRDFAPADRPKTPAVAIVNEAFARRFLNGRDAVGETVSVGGPGAAARFEIVGLVEDAVYRTLRDAPPPTLYTSTTQREAARPFARISVLASIDSPASLTRGIEAAVRAIDPGLTLRFRPLDDQIGAAMNQERLVALLSGSLGALALLLAGIGLYGVIAYAVSRRRAEIGVRLALGAARSAVIRLVMRGIAGPLMGGIAAGALLSLWLVRFVDALMWGLAPRDPATFVSAALVLAAVAIAAGWLPARRASRIDPAAALRE